MANKKPGYQFTIFDQIDVNNTKNVQKKFQEAIAEIENKIDALRKSDPDDTDTENRNDINTALRELRFLEQERDEKISEILKKYPDLTTSR